MTVVFLLFGALALLIALLLFGFVGCGLGLSGLGPAQGTDYASAILKTQCPNTQISALVAYWRLGEPASSALAKDEINLLYGGGVDGIYDKLNLAPADPQRFSPAANGLLALGVTPGLLDLDVGTCIEVDGGFVEVPYHNKLNPAQFTLEAWVSPDAILADPSAKGFYYCLVESTGPQGLVPKQTGWGLYLGPSDFHKNDGPYWQVWMGDGNGFKPVVIANLPPPAPQTLLQLTYLMVTYDGTNVRIWLYYPHTRQTVDDPSHFLAGQTTGVTFVPNDGQGGKGDFLIGVGSDLYYDPNTPAPSQRLYPFKGKIQEVALYNCALITGTCQDPQGVDCSGIMILGNHVLTGSNF
jgi:hypothetical protein